MIGLLGGNNEQNDNTVTNGILVNGPLNNSGVIKIEAPFQPNSSVKKFSSLEKSYNELVKKIQNGENIDLYLSDINIYLGMYQNHSKRDIRDLEEKLIAADREDEIEEALLSKESAAMFIMNTEQNKAIRYLIANILYLIKSNFTKYITPLIRDGKSQYEVNLAIDVHIINPIEETINETEFLPHYKQVSNFLYFLAGNCHICWDN